MTKEPSKTQLEGIESSAIKNFDDLIKAASALPSTEQVIKDLTYIDDSLSQILAYVKTVEGENTSLKIEILELQKQILNR